MRRGEPRVRPFCFTAEGAETAGILPRRHKDTKILVIGFCLLEFLLPPLCLRVLVVRSFTAESAESAEEMMPHGLDLTGLEDLSGLSSVESASADFLVSAREFHSLAVYGGVRQGLKSPAQGDKAP